MTVVVADLFIELLCEEIPARMQVEAEERLKDSLLAALRQAELVDALWDSDIFGGDRGVRSWSGPRRLAVSIKDVALEQVALSEERRGPRADASDAAVEGFAKAAGVARDNLEVRPTPKGDFFFAMVHREGRKAEELLPELICEVVRDFPWPKTMRWGRSGLRWVRPLHRVVAVFGGTPLEGALPLSDEEGDQDFIRFSNKTQGHRTLAPYDIEIASGEAYEKVMLCKNFVVVDRNKRINHINKKMDALAAQEGRTKRNHKGLMDEVSGLVEWPHPIMGAIDDDFMALPEEILVSSMRNHQKYFAVSEADGSLAPRFITVVNMRTNKKRDAVIRKGNERVLRARLADARFFWEQDRTKPLEARLESLKGIRFFDKLGTMHDKALRLSELSGIIAELIGADEVLAKRAGLLAKADLVSETVGEFPELQGIIGGTLAAEQGEDERVSDAIKSHYRPDIPHDEVPQNKVGLAVALADNLDNLSGFFGIGVVPTGSKDPFALRRATLDVVRLIIWNKLGLRLNEVLGHASALHGFNQVPDTVLPFLHGRLKALLRELRVRHDVVSAVLRPEDPRSDDVWHVIRLARALQDMLSMDAEAGLLAGYRRACNILSAEEKKDKRRFAGEVNKDLLTGDAERGLYEQVQALSAELCETTDDLIAQIELLAKLRAPIDAFFEATIVNADEAAVRENRLHLLAQVRALMESVADFSALEG